MAGIAYVRKRLWNPDLLIDPNEIFGTHGQLLKQWDEHKERYSPIYAITWTGATQAGEELGTAAASAKDGTTTPFILTVVSSDVADNRSTAAGAVHSVAAVGVTTNSLEGYLAWQNDPISKEGKLGKPVATVEVVAMNGTTDVLATRYWIWFDALYACEWGTGATDATGNITGESPANTTLIQITAASNEGEGGRWHFPPGRHLVTYHTTIMPTATFAAGDGVVLDGAYINFDQSNNSDPDLNVDYYTYTSAGGSVGTPQEEHGIARHTTINSQVIWTESLIANSIVYHIKISQGLH